MGKWGNATPEDFAKAAELHAAAAGKPRPARTKPATTDVLAKELSHVAEMTINAANSVYRGTAPEGYKQPPAVEVTTEPSAAPNAKSILDSQGPEAMAKWVKEQPQCLVMDTTMRDSHHVILEQFRGV